MVDQPEGRPKSPGPGKVKPVSKKHSVSKPYERPSSSRGVLARVKELITPVTPGWLKDLVLRPPQTTSVTDALEQTVAEVQAAEEKSPEDFKKTLKTLSIPITEVKSEPILPFTTERIPPSTKPATPSILDVTEVNTSKSNLNKSNVLEETLGDIKWSAIRPAVKEKYSFSVAAFNTPSKSPNLSSISIHNKTLSKSTSSPLTFTNRSRVSFGGNSLQRSLLHNRTANHNTTLNDEKKPIKVKPISRATIRPGVTSNTAKKILEQLESLSRPLGHLPSSRPSTPSSRPCSRASTPLSLSRPSTPQHLLPYKAERPVPIRSLTSTPLEKSEKLDTSTVSITSSASVGGKIKREKTNHYSRIKEEEEDEIVVPDFETVAVPKLDFKPIVIENNTDHKPIKIVNQTPSNPKEHVSLKDSFKSTLATNIPLTKKKSLSPDNESGSSDGSFFSFSGPISVTNAALSNASLSDTAEFSFGAPSCVKSKSVEDVLKGDKEEIKEEEEEKDGVKIAALEPPGSWSCVPCKLSNPSTMTRCSGCEEPNPSLKLPGIISTQSPLGIKRAPITPMKPAVSPKHSKPNPLAFGLTKIKEEGETEKKTETKSPLVKFSFGAKPAGWSCDTCLVQNKETDAKCAACQTPKPSGAPEKKALSNKLATMENPLLKFKNTNSWSCETCMLSNPADLEKCQACETAKPAKKPAPAATSVNPLLALAKKGGWTCDTCMLRNDENAAKCPACETPKPNSAASEKNADKPVNKPTGVFQKFGNFKQTGWSCGTCLLTNPDTEVKCKACQTLKPGAKPEDVKTEEKKAEDPPKPSGFSFGISSSKAPAASGFGDIKLSSSFKFGSSGRDDDSKNGFSFGIDKKEDAGNTKPAFSFGTAGGDKPTFTFGQSAEKKVEEPKTSTSVSNSATETKSSEPAFSLGGSSANVETKSAFGSLTSDTAPKFNFGGNKEETKTSAPAPTFNFGSSSTTTTSGFNFGGSAPVPAPDAKPGFNFDGSAPTSSAPASSFGGTAPSSTAPASSFGGSTSTTAAPVFNFGGSKTTTTTAAPAFNFGGGSNPTKTDTPAFQFAPPQNTTTDSGDTMDASSQSPKGFSFGQKPASTNGPSFSFGSNSNSQANTGFNFGSSTAAVPTPSFGATSSATPSFGSGSAPAPSFGSTSTPSFGGNSTTTNSTPSFNFGQNNSTFGQASTATPTPGFNFGGSQTASTGFKFSAPQQQTPSTGFNFGGSAPAAAPTPSFNFGGTPTATPDNKPFTFGSGAPSNPTPSFGAANTSFGGASNPAIPAPTFNFGAGSSTPSAAPFQFGSPQATPTQNNMFNPVTSSTTGRRIKKAVRRTKR